jgi:hypothetical protein
VIDQPSPRSYAFPLRLIPLIAASGLIGLLLYLFITSLQYDSWFTVYLELGRTFLVRNALFNSLIIMGMAAVGGALIWLLLRRKAVTGRPSWHWFVPLLLPGALAVLLWKNGLRLGSEWRLMPAAVRPIMTLIVLWWVTPLLRLAAASGLPWRWWSAGLLAAYVAAADSVTPLLLTGGAPFNATHTLASWSYQQLAVNGDTTRGAAVTVVWLALLGVVVFTFLILTPFRPQRRAPDARRGLQLLWGIWTWLPLFLALLAGLVLGFAPLSWTWLTSFVPPLALTLLALLLAALGARWLGGPGASARQEDPLGDRSTGARLGRLLGLVTLLSCPAVPALLALLTQQLNLSGWHTLALLWLLYGLVGLCGGAAWTLACEIERNLTTRAIALFTGLLIWHGYPAAILVARHGPAPDIATATILHFGAPVVAINSTVIVLSLGSLLLGMLLATGLWRGINKLTTDRF